MKKLSMDEMKTICGGVTWWEKTKCALGAGIVGGIAVAIGPLAGNPVSPAVQQYNACIASYS
jgi:hypothetical protein